MLIYFIQSVHCESRIVFSSSGLTFSNCEHVFINHCKSVITYAKDNCQHICSFQVFDYRNIKTPKEMFDALMVHLKYATNGGNLRSFISSIKIADTK